jgi:hypothetical protein
LLLAMDEENLKDMRAVAPTARMIVPGCFFRIRQS